MKQYVVLLNIIFSCAHSTQCLWKMGHVQFYMYIFQVPFADAIYIYFKLLFSDTMHIFFQVSFSDTIYTNSSGLFLRHNIHIFFRSISQTTYNHTIISLSSWIETLTDMLMTSRDSSKNYWCIHIKRSTNETRYNCHRIHCTLMRSTTGFLFLHRRPTQWQGKVCVGMETKRNELENYYPICPEHTFTVSHIMKWT